MSQTSPSVDTNNSIHDQWRALVARYHRPSALRSGWPLILAGVLLAVAAYFLQMPGLALAVSGLIALLSAGLILFETSRIVNGGETNYVMATVGLYVSVFNLFVSLLHLMGMGGDE